MLDDCAAGKKEEEADMTTIGVSLEGQSSELSHERRVLELADLLEDLVCWLRLNASQVNTTLELPWATQVYADYGYVKARVTRVRKSR